MRTLSLALAATVMLAAGAAQAQYTQHEVVPGSDRIVAPTPSLLLDQRVNTSPPTPAGVQSGAAGNADGSNDFPRGNHPDQGTRSPVSATTRDYPLSWKGTAQDWPQHSQVCASHFPSYDQATDTYQLRKGVMATCPAWYGAAHR